MENFSNGQKTNKKVYVCTFGLRWLTENFPQPRNRSRNAPPPPESRNRYPCLDNSFHQAKPLLRYFRLKIEATKQTPSCQHEIEQLAQHFSLLRPVMSPSDPPPVSLARTFLSRECKEGWRMGARVEHMGWINTALNHAARCASSWLKFQKWHPDGRENYLPTLCMFNDGVKCHLNRQSKMKPEDVKSQLVWPTFSFLTELSCVCLHLEVAFLAFLPLVYLINAKYFLHSASTKS